MAMVHDERERRHQRELAERRRDYKIADDFKAHVRRVNDASEQVNLLQGHICKAHPIDLNYAAGMIPDFTFDEIESAVSLANHQPHDPFEGLS